MVEPRVAASVDRGTGCVLVWVAVDGLWEFDRVWTGFEVIGQGSR